MQNRDIEFTAEGKAILSRETYEEVRIFCRMHGETDLPAMDDLAGKSYVIGNAPQVFPPASGTVIGESTILYSKPSKEVKKLTDE